MTDNSDFMSRYLPPDNTEARREHPGPQTDLTEEVSLTDLRLPEPGGPQPPQMPPVEPIRVHTATRGRRQCRGRLAAGTRQRVSGAAWH